MVIEDDTMKCLGIAQYAETPTFFSFTCLRTFLSLTLKKLSFMVKTFWNFFNSYASENK
jgi:hypothetical protein